jgi:hypothetical protein
LKAACARLEDGKQHREFRQAMGHDRWLFCLRLACADEDDTPLPRPLSYVVGITDVFRN